MANVAGQQPLRRLSTRARATIAGLAGFLAYYVLLLAPAYILNLVNFTMGSNRFHPEFALSLGSQFVDLIMVAIVLEGACRGILLRWLWARVPAVTAIFLANALYVACSAPLWFRRVPPNDLLAIHSGLVWLSAIGLGSSFLYLYCQAILPGVLWSAALAYIPLTLLSNVEFNAPSIFYYVPGHPVFPVLEAAAPWLTVLLLLLITFPKVGALLLRQNRTVGRIFAELLFWLGGYTLLIKFAFPIAFSVHSGEAWQVHVMWDFWWAVHWILGIWLWQGRLGALRFAAVVSAAEIAIIAFKFGRFFGSLELDVWRLAWFINKINVLACFVAMAGWLTFYRGAAGSTPGQSS